jgi:hypothetical protein
MKSSEFRKKVNSGELPLPSSMKKKSRVSSCLKEGMSEESTTKKRHKYNAKKTQVHGIIFDSKAEAERYMLLKEKERMKEIEYLEMQKKYVFEVNDVKIGSYISDFYYYCNQRKDWILEDVKGVLTPVYSLKKKMVKAFYGIDIVEIKKKTK